MKVRNWGVCQAKEMETQVESTDSFKILKYVSIEKLLRSTMYNGK